LKIFPEKLLPTHGRPQNDGILENDFGFIPRKDAI